MNVFDDREKAFEAKYKLDQETAFKVNARRDKLLGLWAAELMGLSGVTAEDYAKAVVEADFEEPGDADVVRKLLKDFAAKGVEMDERHLRKQMDKLMHVAHDQIVSEG